MENEITEKWNEEWNYREMKWKVKLQRNEMKSEITVTWNEKGNYREMKWKVILQWIDEKEKKITVNWWKNNYEKWEMVKIRRMEKKQEVKQVTTYEIK